MNALLTVSIYDKIGLIVSAAITTAVLYYVFFKNGDSK
jgi:hypothetical protein